MRKDGPLYHGCQEGSSLGVAWLGDLACQLRPRWRPGRWQARDGKERDSNDLLQRQTQVLCRSSGRHRADQGENDSVTVEDDTDHAPEDWTLLERKSTWSSGGEAT